MLLLTRKPGQALTIQPGQGADLAMPLGEVFSAGPIVVVVNRLIRDEVRLGIAAHADLQILRSELSARPHPYPGRHPDRHPDRSQGRTTQPTRTHNANGPSESTTLTLPPLELPKAELTFPDNPSHSTLARNMRRLCQQRQWTPADLARASDLSLTTLSAIEQGCGFVSQEDIQRIAQALGVGVVVLLERG